MKYLSTLEVLINAHVEAARVSRANTAAARWIDSGERAYRATERPVVMDGPIEMFN